MSISRSDYLKVVYGQLDDNIRSLISAQNLNSLGDISYQAIAVQNNNALRKANEETTATNTNDNNWWSKVVDTIQDVGTNLLKGILNFGDAVFDFAVNTVDAIGGGNNSWADDITGFDWQSPVVRVMNMGGDFVTGRMFDSSYWTAENFDIGGSQKYLAKQEQNSAISNLDDNWQDLIRGGVQSIGFQLPSLVLAAATGGGSAVALGSMGVGATASQTNEMYDETGNYLGSLGSGLASGLVEVGTELVGGKVLGKLGLGVNKVAGVFGKEAVSEAGESFIKTLGKTMLEEGFEETVSGALQPVVNSIAQGEKAFYNENGQNVYTDLDFWVNGSDSVLAQGMSGALIGGLFGGINQVQMRNAFGVDGTNFASSLEKMGNLQKQIERTQNASKRESLSQEYAMELSKARVYLENVRNKANSTQKANVLKLITNPSEMISTLKNQSDNEINSVIDTRIKELSNVNQFKARNFFNDLQDEFHTNYTLVFDEANNQNAYVDNQDGVIHINENLSEDLAPILVHEYLGHVIGDMIPNSSVNELFNQVKETSWYNSHYNELYKAYMNDENSQLFTSDTDKQAYYQKEVVNKYVEEAFKGNSNTSIRTIRELLKNQSKLTRFLNRLLNRESASMLENDNVVKEFARQIDRVLKFLNETNSNVVEKYLNGETLTASEERVVNKFKSFFDELDQYKTQYEYSKKGLSYNEDGTLDISKLKVENYLKNDDRNFFVDINNEKSLNSYLDKVRNAKTIEEISGLMVIPNFDYGSFTKYVSNINTDLPVVMKERHLYSILNESGILDETRYNYHGISNERFTNALTLKESNIIAVLKSKNKYLFLTNLLDSNGNNILAVFKFQEKAQNYLITIYGKALNDKFFANNEILYINAKNKKVAPFQSNYGGNTTFGSSNIDHNREVVNKSQNDYNNSYERTNEFRRLQEESRKRTSQSSWYESFKEFDERVRTRLSNVFREQIQSTINSDSDVNGLLENTNNFKIYKNINGQLFHDIFEIVRPFAKNGELVDIHENYNDTTCYISDDGLSGFAITNNGDLVSVFNASDKRGFLRSITNEVKAQAKTLDCYSSPNQPLNKMYSDIFGFKTASIMDYNMEYDHDNIAQNHNSPQVAFMVNTNENVETKHFSKDQYDEAQSYQLSFLKNKKPRFEYSKDLEPLETNEAVKVKKITDRSLNSVITLHGTREVYNQVIERIEKDFGISLKVNNKSAKARRLFEDFNLMNREFTKDNIRRFIDDILNQNIDKSNTTFRSFLETKNIDVDFYVKSSADTLFYLLTNKSNPSTTSKRLTRFLEELKTARDNLQATNKVLRNNASMIRSLENRIKNYASDTTTVKGALNTLKSFISHIGFTKQGVLSASTLEHIRKLYQDGSFENMVKSILNPYQGNLQIENLTIQANALIELASDLSSSHIENNTLNASQIQNIGLLVRGVKKLYEDFNTGVIESARKEASNLIETAKQTKEVYKHSDSKLLQTANRLLLNYASPKTMFAFMLGGTNSDAFKSVYEDLYKKPYERQIKAYNEFKSKVLDNTKTLQKNRYAKVKGTKFRKYVIYQLYLNQKSPENLTRLTNSTLSFTERKGVVKYYKFSELEKLINANLSETEIKELDYLFNYYNKELKDYVEKSSEKILGFSVSRENYYPIVSSDVFKTTNFSNPSSIRYNISAMNNNRLKALTNNKTHIEINVDPINLFDDYIESMTITGEIGLESQKLNRLFQLKNDNGESLFTTISSYLPDAKTFVSSAFNKLIANTQVIERSGFLDKLIGKASVATLGLNPGTMLRQLGSLFTAARYTGGIANGIKTIINPTTYARIYKHRAWLKANNPVFLNRISNDGYVRGTTLSAGAMEFSSSALQKISRATMVGIEYMDRFTCYTTFEMAQDFVKAKYGYELNSEKNLNKANEIFTDILLDTQSNSDRIATSRLRAGEEGNFMKNLFGLFGSDNQNKLSILMQDVIDETNIKNNKSYDESTRKALLTKNRKYIVTDTGALVVGAVFMALVNMLNDFLLDREEPETYDYSLLFFDSLKSMFDWTPYFGTMLNWFVYGGVDYFPIENLSELVETGGQLLDVVQNKKKFDKNLAMNLIIKMANMLGIPAENFQKYGLGIMSNFSPKVAYQTRNMLYGVSQSYLNSEYSKGKESNNFNKMLNAFEMNSALYKATLSTNNATEIVRLKNKGLQINAYNVPETYTDKEGKEITLTEEERNNFKLVYDNLDGVLTKIINSSIYKSATDEEKASLINKAYQTYYEYALGRFSTKLSYLASLKGIDLSRIILGTNENNNLHLSTFEKLLVKFASGKSLKEEERYSLYLQLVKLGLNRSVAKELFDI